MRMTHPNRSVALVAVGAVVAGLFCLLSCVVIGRLFTTLSSSIASSMPYSRPPAVYKVTKPLDAEVVKDICQRFGLSPQDTRCEADATVYAVDFFDLPRKAFRPNTSTYADVYEKLGPYEYQCREPEWNSDGTWTFRCYYDFKGDHTYNIIVRFLGTNRTNGIVEKILLDAGDSPP